MHYLVAFINREESQNTLALAVQLAVATEAHLTVLHVIADPRSVGVVAELVATDEPFLLASEELEEIVDELMDDDIDAKGVIFSAGEVGEGIVSAALELEADMIFIGTGDVRSGSFLMQKDPVARYVVDHCPVNVVLVRGPHLDRRSTELS